MFVCICEYVYMCVSFIGDLVLVVAGDAALIQYSTMRVIMLSNVTKKIY